jgi:hypothetical protein
MPDGSDLWKQSVIMMKSRGTCALGGTAASYFVEKNLPSVSWYDYSVKVYELMKQS